MDFDWVVIPAGAFLMGSDRASDKDAQDNELPQHEVQLAEFRIARVPITVAQFALFVEATSYVSLAERVHVDATWRTPPGEGGGAKPDHPVTCVTWLDAQTFCAWAGVSLPSEAEWEKAARGTDGRRWPWGNTLPNKKHCNFEWDLGVTTAVDAYPAGASPYGVLDMVGNVWEWTNSLLRAYPYNADDGREDVREGGLRARRTVRGGAFGDYRRNARAARRAGYDTESWFNALGFGW